LIFKSGFGKILIKTLVVRIIKSRKKYLKRGFWIR